MDEATRARAFEPFFTTKPAGRGTGLGLSSVHGIVLQSGGAIAIDSAPDAGTDVVVYLPAANAPVQADAEPRRRSAPKERATGTVLVVEDDDPVRRVTRRALESAGYRVLEAADAEQALAHAERAAIDLVVSDIVMPGVSGLELADRIAASHPGIPVLLVSGYADDAFETRRARGAGRELLPKPFRPQELVERVAQLLDARRASFAGSHDAPRGEPCSD
jgi:CheY-like chemotaxis protein